MVDIHEKERHLEVISGVGQVAATVSEPLIPLIERFRGCSPGEGTSYCCLCY